jgi:uncharacterized membrane protein YeaQ/YmgE (transglycosylase-associated protein family)
MLDALYSLNILAKFRTHQELELHFESVMHSEISLTRFTRSSGWSRWLSFHLSAFVGLFVSLMLHFGAKHGAGKQYFYAAMVGYVAGLIATLIVMYKFAAAQPALLYIVPGVVGAVFAQAVARGEVSQLWQFEDEESDADKETSEKDEAKKEQ